MNDKLLNSLNAQIYENQDEENHQKQGDKLRSVLRKVIASKRLKDPSGYRVERLVTLGEVVILVLKGDWYWKVEAVGETYDGGYTDFEVGDVLTIAEADKAGLLTSKREQELLVEYNEWTRADLRRREEASASATIKRLASTYGQVYIKRLLDGDEVNIGN